MIASLPIALGATAAMGRDASAFVTAGARMDAPRGFADMCRNGGPLCGDRAMVQTIARTSTGVDQEDGRDADGIVPADATAAILTSADILLTSPLLTSPDVILTERRRSTCAAAPTAAPDMLSMAWPAAFVPAVLPDLPLSLTATDWREQPRGGEHCVKASLSASFPFALAPLPELAPVMLPAMLSTPAAFPAPQPEPQPALLIVTADPITAFSSQPAPVRGRGHELLNLRTLQNADTYVNRRVIQRSDMQIFGRGEVWRRSGTYRGAMGDCEDIAIEKRMRLIEAGFPEDRLFFAVVYRTDIALHTLLIARLDDGDYVLDSRTRQVVPWNEAPYIWVSIQNPGKPDQWFSPARQQDRIVQRGAASVDIG